MPQTGVALSRARQQAVEPLPYGCGSASRAPTWLAALLLLSAVCAAAGEDAGPDDPAEDDGPLAEIVPLPPLKRSPASVRPAQAAGGRRDAARPVGGTQAPQAPTGFLPMEAGYALVLGGVLDANLELGPERSPVLIRGDFTVPEHVTLRIKAGTCIHLRAARAAILPDCGSNNPGGLLHALAEPPATNGTFVVPRASPTVAGVSSPCPSTASKAVPQPAQNVWVWGTLLAEGITGNPVELTNQEKQSAALVFYGAEQSKLEGVRLKGLSVTQAGGVCLWTNCEFTAISHYALASGAALVTHCTFRACGGIFANYKVGPWSLLVRRSLFDGCREGIVLGSDPGEKRLIIEKNCFFKTRGAHLRVMPLVNAQGIPDARAKNGDTEFLIGENWYGSALLEEAELRLVDCRVDPAVRARLNTRPPAERPYTNTGAGIAAAVLAATLREQQTVQQKLLQAHPQPQPKPPVGRVGNSTHDGQAAIMSKAVSRPK